MKWFFIVFCIYLASLFVRDEHVPGRFVEALAERYLPKNLVLHVDSLVFGFRHGIHVRGLRLYDSTHSNPLEAIIGADSIDFYPFMRRIRIEGARYQRLPDGYYAPGNFDKKSPLDLVFPNLGKYKVTLVRPDILAVKPEVLTFDVSVTPEVMKFDHAHLIWPDRDVRMEIDGHCVVDLLRQEVSGEVAGLTKQAHIRPLLVALDVPVALPYMDGFTEVPEPVNAKCAWKVDLKTNDLDLWLDLHPILGKYNSVPMKKADGTIHLHNYTRNNCLNYKTTVGPISAVDRQGRTLDGTVVITGTNRYNTVDVSAKSLQPLADVLKIGGFVGDYVGSEVIGKSDCTLQFRFPRSMTNNYEVLNGFGHVTVKDGQLMRMKGFKGLIEAMPSVAPAVTWFSDSTQASCDYVIENGVIKSDSIYIEGTLFSIKMYGQFDAVKEKLDFTVRVQFAKKDSLVGKVLHPLTWPFTKLLLEFRLTGSPENPKWEYVTVLDRVLEVLK